ncbi:MAG: endonuclease III [Saprospiraceae bacterium]
MDPIRLQIIVQRLEQAYGRQTRYSTKSPMDQLIATILSQRTNYADEMQAFHQMRARYPTWEEVAAAPVAELEATIQPSRFPELKAPRIQEVIRRIIADHGDTELRFLNDMTTEAAQAYLMSLPGVGYKTSTFVLLFSLRRPVLPVDTHVHRVSTRTGILPAKTSQEKAHILLLSMLPKDPDELLNFHKLLFKHGQEVCTFNFPKCRSCPLKDVCAYYAQSTTATGLPLAGI